MEQYFRGPPGCHTLFWALAKLNAKEMVSVGGDEQLVVCGGGRQRTSDGECQRVKQYTVRSTSSETRHVCVYETGIKLPGFKSYFHHLLVPRPWAYYLATLCLSFLICEMVITSTNGDKSW